MCQSICQSFSVEYIVNFLVYLHYLAPVQKKKFALLYKVKKKLICLVEFAFAAQISEIHTMLKYQGIKL